MGTARRGSAVALAVALVLLALVGPATPTPAAAQASDRTIRVFAVSYRQELARIETYEVFREVIGQRFEDEVVPHLRGDGLDLVTYPENTSLMGYLVGSRGAAARAGLVAAAGEANSGAGALASLAGPYASQMAYYESHFPGVDAPGQLLQLALTDTLARLVVETFSDLAAEHGVWIAVSSNLAPFERITGPEVGLLADPEADTSYAYVATDADVRNRNLVFAPDGTLATVQDKAYLVPIERERGLGLSLYGIEVTDLEVADLPIGRVATVISKDAWMPDVNERLDQLRAQVLVQSEAFSTWGQSGGDLWPPDKFQRGGWWMVQKEPSFALNVTPQLVGNLGDLPFDGQGIIAVPGPAGDPTLCLSGQAADVGWAAVGPWAAGEARDLCDPALRPELEATSADLAPGSGTPTQVSYVESTVHADVVVPTDLAPRAPLPPSATPSVAVDPAPADDAVQLHPTVAVAGSSRHVAWIEDVGGATRLRVVELVDDRSIEGFDPVTPARHDHFDNEWDPTLVIGPAGPLVLHTAFPTENWDLFARTPGGDQARVDDAESDVGVLRERGHSDPDAVTLGDGTLVAAWSDLRWPWIKPQVRVATSTDGGASWSASTRVDGGPAGGEAGQLDARDPGESRGQAFPVVVADARGVVVAWQEHDDDGVPATWLARSADVGRTWSTPIRLSPPDVDARRPALAVTASGLVAGWEEPTVDGGRVVAVPLGADDRPDGPADPIAPGGHGQRHLSLVPVPDDAVAAVFEDRRGGDGDVVVSWLDAATLERFGTERIDDAPAGADAIAPAAAPGGELGDVVVVWQDRRDDGEHVRIVAASAPGAPSVPPSPPLPATGGGLAVVGAVAMVIARRAAGGRRGAHL